MAGETQIEPEVEEESSLMDDVRAAFEQHSAPEDAEKLRADRPRDEHGKFKAVEAAETQAPAEAITDADRPDEQVAKPSTAGEPPTSWSAGEKAEWSKIPPAVQAAVLRRETEINEGGRQWSEQKRSYEQALGPVSELAQEYQLPVGDAIQRLVNVERRLGNPQTAPQVIAELANAYGVNLAALVNGSQQPQGHPAVAPIDPNMLFQQLDQRLDTKLSQLEAQRQQEAETNSIISTFSSEKDAAGQLAHPHFDEVKVLMGHFLQSGQATDMQDAYDKAVWAMPETRTAMLEAQSKASQVTAQRGQAVKARKAAVSLNGAPGGGTVPSTARQSNGNGSVEDDVRAAWNAVMDA